MGPRSLSDPLPDREPGTHGPGSPMWHINREAVLLGAGPAALLLQVAHPLVAEGVAAHSAYRPDPFGRLRRTLRTTLDLVFGDEPTSDAAVRRLNGVHARVRGEVHDPERQADDGRGLVPRARPAAPAVGPGHARHHRRTGLRRLGGTPQRGGPRAVLAGSRFIGSRLGIPPSFAPATWTALEGWFEAMLAPGGPIRVTPTAEGPCTEHPAASPALPAWPCGRPPRAARADLRAGSPASRVRDRLVAGQGQPGRDGRLRPAHVGAAHATGLARHATGPRGGTPGAHRWDPRGQPSWAQSSMTSPATPRSRPAWRP